ncbi:MULTISPECIES: hypothetical protein [unclassified Nocardia]|uniref:hypothetical protein n=1 Tax=unclassified Nocardia TaxID=2637762 RepID=UPI0033B25AC0
MTEEEFNKQFARLYAYMDKRFDAVDAELAKKADEEEIDAIYTELDGIAESIDDIRTDQAAMNDPARSTRTIASQGD